MKKTLLFSLTVLIFWSCNSYKKQVESVQDVPCQEVVDEHFVVNTNAYNITKLYQEGDKLYVFGQVSGCSTGKLSVMWNKIVQPSEPPQVAVDFKTYEAGLCDQMVQFIWCFDITPFKNLGSKEVMLQIAETQSSILLEF
jgi:PKD repeat protein